MSLPRQLDHRVKNRKLKCTARTGGSGCDAGGPGASEMPSIPTPPNWSPYDRLPDRRRSRCFGDAVNPYTAELVPLRSVTRVAGARFLHHRGAFVMPAPDPSAKVSPSRDIAMLTSALTLEEKAALTVGIDSWRTASFPRLGIPSVKTTDGPNGARGDTLDHASITPSVCIPSATSLGATWDPAVVEQASAIVARQALEKGCRVLLAPTVNLHRHPLWGRNFECFSEDPVLTGKLAVAYIDGVRKNDVVATIKHFVGNEVEHERNTSSSDIDERALRELYLLPFEYGVRNAGVLALMTSYNRVNGRFVPDDGRLLDGILRKEWGFAGFVMTDWSGIAGTVEAATAGLDESCKS